MTITFHRGLIAGITGMLLLGGCASAPPVNKTIPGSAPVLCPPTPVPAPAPIPRLPVTQNLRPADWNALPGWQNDQLLSAWNTWLQSCNVLKAKPDWQVVCAAAANLQPSDTDTVRTYFQTWFNVYQSLQPDGAAQGLVTGYYEPLLHGSRTPSPDYPVPLYRTPPDLLNIDLSSVYPELKHMRLRGRLQGNTVVPYLDRAEIDGSQRPLAGNELVWVDDPVEAFFLQIQGSGRIQLNDGTMMQIGYANQNGYPYRAIGHVLVQRGELKLEQASMQNIKAWGRAHPEQLPELLSQNPSYVFFKQLPDSNGPLGALGLPLTGGRSIAVDSRAVPLGAPVWLATTQPQSDTPMDLLVMAQDTGGAIHGNVRADFYFGFGDAAGKLAGKMKQQGQMWVLLPKTMTVASGPVR
ncbi:MAG: murein transglycosylase A [Burkholderiales bacterium]